MNPNFSRLFNRHAWSDDAAFDELAEAVFASLSIDSKEKLIVKSNNKGSVSPQTILKVVLVDQYLSYKQNPKLCTAFSRKINSWIVSSQYNGLEIPRKIIDVVDALIEAEYLSNEDGKFYKQTNLYQINLSRLQELTALPENVVSMTPSPSHDDGRDIVTVTDKPLPPTFNLTNKFKNFGEEVVGTNFDRRPISRERMLEICKEMGYDLD